MHKPFVTIELLPAPKASASRPQADLAVVNPDYAAPFSREHVAMGLSYFIWQSRRVRKVT